MLFVEAEAKRFGFRTSYRQTRDKIVFVLEKGGRQGTFALPANRHKDEHFFIDNIKSSVRRIRNELKVA